MQLMQRHWRMGLAIVIAVTLVSAAAVFWWWVPKWEAERLSPDISDPKALVDIENSFRSAISQLLGGAAVLVGAVFAYYQFWKQQQTSQKQIKATYDQLISQQVSKGFEQLASDKLAMRLGGIYALEGVMNTSEQYHKPVLEALCAFVRDGTKIGTTPAKPAQSGTSNRPPDSGASEPPPPATDIQAALTVIGRRAAGKGSVNLFKADLSRAFLPEADLSGANLLDANLSKANLSRADLSKANLSRADLSRAYLIKADLSRADLSGANLSGANLSGACLIKADLSRTVLGEANLSRALLPGANLSGAKYVSQEQLDAACGDKDTKLPPGLTIEPCPLPKKEVR